jgi:branched-chain amino acid transport system ATP-binding protein
MFQTIGLTRYFGGLSAVSNLSITIQTGEIVGLIGPNGAGKTTVFNLITGFLRPSKGQVVFKGTNIVGQKPHRIAEMGIARTFQIAKMFPQFTVLQNMKAASHLFTQATFVQGMFRTPGYRKKERAGLDHAIETLGFVGLDKWKNMLAGALPHGHQKLLGVAMALATKPALVLLDEPLEGMNSGEVNSALDIIRRIRDHGVTILLIEHNMRAVMRICDRLIVLNFGKEIARGTPEEVKQNQEVVRAYLGASEHVS